MGNTITILEVIDIAEEVALKINIIISSKDIILKHINKALPVPMLFNNDNYQMWVDKYYIAYSNSNETKIHYVYLTKKHISEEYYSYNEVRRKRGIESYLPQDINDTFIQAINKMSFTDKNYYISKEFQKRIVNNHE
jgi:uncharacterized protein YfaT (DUF1175 family)